MRKREIEKLLVKAVADALGLEIKAPRRHLAGKATEGASFKKERQDHRAAA